MLHNEVEGWKLPAKCIRESAAVFLLDRETPAWMRKKIRALRRYLAKEKVPTMEISAAGKSFPARVFSLMVLGDWVSYELALLNKVNPLKIPVIEAIKKIK
jgi:glucose/mannose-6-phosphate isomerase